MIDLIHRCRECPREDWSDSEYDLLVREDLSAQVRQMSDNSKNLFKTTTPINTATWGEIKSTETNDGMEDMEDEVSYQFMDLVGVLTKYLMAFVLIRL